MGRDQHDQTGPEAAATAAAPICGLRAAAERLIRFRSRFGISRVGDITGLDRLGIPVVQAVRPLALSNAVSQGKGLERDQAVISAILEAVETFFAERVDAIPSFLASADELSIPMGHFDGHVRPDAANDWRGVKLAWTEGTNILSDRRLPVPLELVHTCFTEPPPAHDGVFFGSTTGLAAAFGRNQAVLHGLLEAIERDAVARGQRAHGLFARARIDEASIADGAAQALLDRVAGAGLLVGLWALEGAGGVPVIWCQLMESGERPVLIPFAAEGFAAHPDPAIALQKAMIEAAQARLAAISGARDDISRAFYPTNIDWDVIAGTRRLLREGPRPVDFRRLLETAGDATPEGLDGILVRLSSAGIAEAIVVPLGCDPEAGVDCVRVVVPGLEPLLE